MKYFTIFWLINLVCNLVNDTMDPLARIGTSAQLLLHMGEVGGSNPPGSANTPDIKIYSRYFRTIYVERSSL